MRLWKLTTKSGSEYFVRKDAEGKWWLSANNIPNKYSRTFPEGYEYLIHPPEHFPPTLGERFEFRAASYSQDIMSHGYLVTSRIVEVVEL